VWHSTVQSGDHEWIERRTARALYPLLREIESLNDRIKEYDRRIEQRTHIASGRVATRDVLWACSLGVGTRARANHKCASAKKGTSIYGHCWYRGHTTFWDPSGKIVICGAGLKLSARGGKNAKKRAVVAVARKLAVLLHRLWVSGEVYEPLRNSQKAMSTAA